MLYFSEINKTEVYLKDNRFLGKLDDLIFSIGGNSYIKKIVVLWSNQNFLSRFNPFKKEEKIIISLEFVKKFSHVKIVIDENYTKTDIEENELYVKQNLLDTQVIDIEENNIVRVNDVLIQNANSHSFVIYGVDIGLSGVLRWFNLERAINKILRIFGRYYVSQSFLAWSDIQPLELTRGRVVVSSRFDKLKKLHPADLADYLETQNFKNIIPLIEGMDKEYLAHVISELNPNFQTDLFKIMSIENIARIISLMDPDDAVDVIIQFSNKKQESILNKMSDKEASQIRRLLKYSSTPLGEFLNTDYLTVYPEETVSDVIKRIKKMSDFSILIYVYVVNKNDQLVGTFSLHELLLQDLDKQVFTFINQRVIVANLNTPMDVAFRRMVKYKIECLPVLDEKKRMLGIVSIDDLAEEIIQEKK